MSFFISNAMADAAAPAAAGPMGGGFEWIFLVGFLVIFYLMIWRPQAKRAKEQKNLLGSLQKGDEVVTTGGIAGKITKAPSPPRSATRSAALPAAASATTVRTAAAPQADSDVALLTALVAHSGSQPGAGRYLRDVAERSGGDSTDALLRRCQRLAVPEAGLCRARICNGQWLHEAACRVPLDD
eukprot:gene37857-46715_t